MSIEKSIEKILIELQAMANGWREDAKQPQYADSKVGLLEAADELEDYVRSYRSLIEIKNARLELQRKNEDEHKG